MIRAGGVFDLRQGESILAAGVSADWSTSTNPRIKVAEQDQILSPHKGADHGYDIFIADYRGYGKSEGTPSPRGLYLDTQAAFDYALKLKAKKNYPQFIVAGQSLGGSLVLKLLSEEKNKKEKVDLVILDSTFRSNSQVGAAMLRKHWLTFLLSPLSYLLLQDNYNASIDDLRQWNYPTLCVTHLRDPVVPAYLTQQIYEYLNPQHPKWLWLRNDNDVGHINSFLLDGGSYNLRLLAFLKDLEPRSTRGPVSLDRAHSKEL